MKISKLPIVFLLTLTSCFSAAADQFDNIRAQEGFVPVAEVPKNNTSRIYECTKYLQSDQSCERFSQPIRSGAETLGRTTILLFEGPTVVAEFTSRLQDVNGLECYDGAETTIEVPLPAIIRSNLRLFKLFEDFKTSARETFVKQGVLCNAYFRSGTGYLVKTFHEDGSSDADYPSETVRYLTIKPKLRLPPG